MDGFALSRALDIPRGVTAFVGGGGKTTLIMELAGELAKKYKVLIAATTKMYRPDCPVLIAPTALEAVAAFEKNDLVAVGSEQAEGKIGELPELQRLYPVLADCTLVEADGARGLPLKAPAEHEPVIPAEAVLTVALLGMDGIGKPVSEVCHRPELYAKAAGIHTGDKVTPEAAARVLVSAKGQRKNVRCRYAVVLNKADTPERLAAAREVAALLEGTALITALKNEEKLIEVWRDGLCLY